jgi:sensor histidine kinase YesM
LITTFNKICWSQSIIQNRIYTAGAYDKKGISIGFAVDSTTTVLSYFQNFNNLPNTYFNLIENAKHIQFSVTYKTAALAKNYMYTLVDENDQPISSGCFSDLPYETNSIFGISYLLPVNEIKNKIISLIIFNKENPKIGLTTTVYNKPIQKNKTNVLLWGTIDKNGQKGYSVTPIDKKIELSISSAPLIVSMDKTPFEYIYTLLVKDLNTNKTVYEDQNWNYSYINSEDGKLPYIVVNNTIFKKSGKYELIIQPKLNFVNEKKLSQYSTSKIIKVEWKKEYHMTEILVAVLSTTTLLLLIGFPLYRNWGRRKILKEKFQKRLAETELKVIRSQLNPHFLFNSLASIQSLVNTNEIEQANKYISHFSKLTRSILDNQNYNTVQTEINLLTDYLEMEKLRDIFHFQINISENLDREVEIPSMLLQPLLENAITHGLSTLENGKILVQFGRSNDDLIISIEDNGIGFDSQKDYQGFGLKLTKERISLLNQIHKETPIHITIDSNNTGTKIFIHFKNWLT